MTRDVSAATMKSANALQPAELIWVFGNVAGFTVFAAAQRRTTTIQADTVERLHTASIRRLVFGLPAAESSEVLPIMRQYAQMARRFEPAAPV